MKYLAISLGFAATATLATAQVTGAGTSAYSFPDNGASQISWIDYATPKTDLSLYIFGWNKRNPLIWVEAATKWPWKLGKATLTPGVFLGLKHNSQQAGPLLGFDYSGRGWSLYAPLYLIFEHKQQPSLFVPAARIQFDENRNLRLGIEGAYSLQGRSSSLQIGPTGIWRVNDGVSLRFTYLKGVNGAGDEMRTTLLFRF